MSKHIALLRGINVAGHNKIAMSDLRDVFVGMGFGDAKTVLQSGNVIFESDRQTSGELEELLEKETVKRLAASVDYVIRTAEEWEKIVARNPFPNEAKNDPGHLVVMCLKKSPSAKDVKVLRRCIKGPELIHCDKTQLYITYPDGIGRSKLSGTVIEKQLGIRGTARNWNTILKLLAFCK